MARKEEPTLITDTTDIADVHLAAMIEARERILGEQKIMSLRAEALRKRLDDVVRELQEYCPHKVTEETSSYFSGSYNDRASTTYSQTCNHCGKLLKTWDVTHNYYG